MQLGLKPHLNQTKMHINLASKKQRLLAGSAAGGEGGAVALIAQHIAHNSK